MRKHHILLSVFILSFAQFAHAGLFIEPFVGYVKVQTDYKYKLAYGGTSDKIESTGIAYGGNLGWAFKSGFRIGAEAEVANLDLKYETSGTKEKWTSTAALLILGYKFPKDIVGYVGVGQGSSVDDETPKTTVTGTILKAGATRELVKHVAISVEWVMFAWNDSKVEGGTTTKFTDVYDKYVSNGIQASLRFPFEFGGK